VGRFSEMGYEVLNADTPPPEEELRPTLVADLTFGSVKAKELLGWTLKYRWREQAE